MWHRFSQTTVLRYWIQNFTSLWLVAPPVWFSILPRVEKKKRLIHTFYKGINIKGNTKSLVLVLNSAYQTYFSIKVTSRQCTLSYIYIYIYIYIGLSALCNGYCLVYTHTHIHTHTHTHTHIYIYLIIYIYLYIYIYVCMYVYMNKVY